MRLQLSLIFANLLTLIKSNAVPHVNSGQEQQISTRAIIYGVVPEDVQSLQPIVVTPPILSDGQHDVCEYKLERYENGEPIQTNDSIPFRVILQDKKTGSALFILGEGTLDYEVTNHYELNLLTIFCDGSIPVSRQRISIRVSDVNEFPPEWKEQGYLAEVEEGKLYDPLLKVEAFDRDGSESNSKICHYRLLTGGVPFTLDDRGYLKNTEPLAYDLRHNYILEVMAEDCGGLSSKVFVNILITEKCRAGWKGLKKEKIYALPSRGPSRLLAQKEAILNLCSAADNCTVDQVTVSLRLLKTNVTAASETEGSTSDDFVSLEIESTCDLDSQSVERRLEACESDLGMIDLLNPSIVGWNGSLLGSEGLVFNGSTAYVVPTYRLQNDQNRDYIVRESADDDKEGDKSSEETEKSRVETVVMTRDGPNSKFSISMWMKRDYEDALNNEGKEEKQSILCSSDGEGMNRNHISLFLHNCHLVMLARFEPSGRHLPDVLRRIKKQKKMATSKGGSSSIDNDDDDDDNAEVTMDGPERNEDDEFYRPSEWHWKLEQTCDNRWHHYTVNVDKGKARLFVDGNLFIDTPRNPVTLEDHALHLSKKVHSTKLTVGACWKGLTGDFGDHFRGRLAELRLLRRSNLRETTIKCVSNCNEKLDFHSINEMESGMSISMNSQMTELTINGRTKASVEHLLSTVGYTNPKTKWSPESDDGSVPSVVSFQTSLKCTDEGRSRFVSRESLLIRLVPAEGDPPTTKASNGESRDDSSLFISGTQRLDQSEKEVGRGIPVFKDVVVYRYPVAQDLSYEELIKGNHQANEIGSCTIRVSPAMDEEVEDLVHPHSLAYEMHLRVDTSLEGLVVKGPGRVADFVELLQKVTYIHKRPEDLNKKLFVLFCHDGAGKKSKDDLVVELNAIHYEYMDDSSQQVGHMGQDKSMHGTLDGLQKANGIRAGDMNEAKGVKGNASVVATITICICALMVVIAVGTYRVFFHRQKTVRVHVDDQQELQWDGSSITITVNPLETAALKEEPPAKERSEDDATLLGEMEGYYDDDDDIGSAHEMMRDTEEEEEEEEEDEEEEGEGVDGGKGKRQKKKDKYSDEDASKINHFVLSDTE